MVDDKEFIEKFSSERKEISDYIKINIIDNLNDISKVGELQVHIASQRQRLSDKIASLRISHKKIQTAVLKRRKELYYDYKRSDDFSLQDTQINKHIDADVSKDSGLLDVIDIQIDFYKRTIDGLDKMGFFIKYLIESTKFLEGY